MAHIQGRYSTNHPKDVAARYLKKARQIVQEQGCTRKELNNPTEANVRKCMYEIKNTAKMGENFKVTAKFLGEDTNLDKSRRNR